MKNCLNCGNEVLRQANAKYCSNKCKNCVRGKRYRERHKKICKICNIRFTLTFKQSYCQECKLEYFKQKSQKFIESHEQITVGELKNKFSTYEFHAKVRAWARNIYKFYNEKLECKKCGYSTYCEICHIKPVAEFNNLSTIKEVNSIQNLICLCPNHHWEFDHKLLVLPGVGVEPTEMGI